MKTCRFCGEENRKESILCRFCGNELRQTLVVDTFQPVPTKPQLPLAPSEPELTLMIVTPTGVQPITVPPGEQITLGRTNQGGQANLHLDFDPFAAAELGVSRLHAVINYTQPIATIADLESTNGTYLNGQKLKPYQAHILRYGD